MTDRRLTPFSGRVALESLRGQIAAPAFTAGEAAQIVVPVADLCASPGGARDRQLQFGAPLTVIDRHEGHGFVQAEDDGYCGWVAAPALGPRGQPGHRVCVPATHVYARASIKSGDVMRLGLGARVSVLAEEGGLARTPEGFIPHQHLRPLSDPEPDPVAVAERLLGTPYLWGGNSRDGIDCSGLVQLAFACCGLPCPGDSDQQWQALGTAQPEDTPPRRGDLLFWRGHVALVCGPDLLIHANGHSMSVAHEGIAAARARIAASGEAAWLGLRRP